MGKALFYRYANVELLDIEDNDLFEKFDYIIPHSSIYVDFKNWHENSFKESDKEMLHIIKKTKECGGRCVIIANIISDNTWSIRENTIDGIKIVVIPALFTNDNSPKLVDSAWDKIRECIREYTD